MIRDANAEDAPAIGAIWNPVVRDTAITFWPTPRSDADIRDYMAARQSAGHGCFVWVENDRVLGFAAYGQFRNGGGYAHSMEHTIYTAEAARGRGLGGALLKQVEDHAQARGARLMIGGVTGSNTASIAFHRRHGYGEWGRIPDAGFKFGQWHDLVLMGKHLVP
ncbi:MAG: N-acetyltransferase family protein [Paracoccus denitrificans]|uniref:N-acetyltransferase family protein n=1 Tax=Paracoccus denitrificans TaxID=266 RepID=A0A533IBV1_PARDE|nr:MAG: N-acetyltransferase family protein [Paracoccus denitrificans]